MNQLSWTNLALGEHTRLTASADVCVIGAGAAGIYLSTQLARRGSSVVLLEAGPTRGISSDKIGFDVMFSGKPYSGATAGRFFGIGGSTTRWGGSLVPHTHFDLRAGNAQDEIWSHIISTVITQAPTVLHELGYHEGNDFETFAKACLGDSAHRLTGYGLQVLSNLYLPFQRRNLTGLLKRQKGQPDNIRVFFNAVAKSWQGSVGYEKNERFEQLVAISRNQNELKIIANKFVICAGAIESARILLELQGNASQPGPRKTAMPGVYLGDHLSLPIADVAPANLDLTAKLFAPRFHGPWMRGFRFLETTAPTDAPRAFAHFIFANHSRGFDLAKEVLSAAQQQRIPRLNARDIFESIGDIAKLGYDRILKSRLFIPQGTPTYLQLDIEQIPSRDNRIKLLPQRDSYGRQITQIDWKISNLDRNTLANTAQRFLAKWPGLKAGLPELQSQLTSHMESSEGIKPHDAYHPVGCCRMGDDMEAVVDTTLKVWGVDNLWLVSTAVLPSAGTANPTFTMLCLAHELAYQLHQIR